MKKFIKWFNFRIGWFFTNGRKIEKMQLIWDNEYLQTKKLRK